LPGIFAEMNSITALRVKKTTRLLLIAITLVCLYVVVIEWLFQKRKSSTPVQTEYWSHRGVNSDSLPENTIAAFEHVLKFGLTGIETDVFWVDAQQRFIVTHDAPQPGIVYPTLEEITARFKDSISYWIDFKNLSKQNQPQAEAVLAQLMKQFRLHGKLYVESANAGALRKFHTKGIQKLYWLQYGRNFPVRPLKLLFLKSLIVFSSFDGYTSAYSLYDADFRKQFNGLPLYIFYADAASIEKEKQQPSSVKVQLADADYLDRLKK
jgi:Glycerophosphoryl diester phosphodiesterase family